MPDWVIWAFPYALALLLVCAVARRTPTLRPARIAHVFADLTIIAILATMAFLSMHEVSAGATLAPQRRVDGP